MYKIRSKILSHLKSFTSIVSVKNVSTWSPLATAFNSPPSKKINFTQNETVSGYLKYAKISQL